MNNQIKVYYIPTNPKIIQGRIYSMYINNNTNLDLSSIQNTRNIKLPKTQQSNSTSIMISEKDYTRLLELNNLAYQLTTKRTNNIQTFLNEETKTISELTKINTERQELIKKLTPKGEKKWITEQKYIPSYQPVQE